MKETQKHSEVDSFAKEFRDMINSNPPSLLHEQGILITKGEYEIHIFAAESADASNEVLIQLVDRRMDLLRNTLESNSFKDFIDCSIDLSTWLEQRGLRVGLSATTKWAGLRLRLFKWFPYFFGV